MLFRCNRWKSLYNLSITCHTHSIDYRAFHLEKLQFKHWVKVYRKVKKQICYIFPELWWWQFSLTSLKSDFAINSSLIDSGHPRNAVKRGIFYLDFSEVNWFIVIIWDDGCVGVFTELRVRKKACFFLFIPLPLFSLPAPQSCRPWQYSE